MSIQQRSLTGRFHRQQHTDNRPISVNDITCSICHPPVEVNQQFLNFWENLQQFAPSADEYSEVTIQRFITTYEVAIDIQLRGSITNNTGNILRHYQQTVNSIYFRQNPSYTSADLALFVALSYFISNNYTRTLSERVIREIKAVQNPVLNDHPCYRIINQIIRSWGQQVRGTRTQQVLAPEIIVEEEASVIQRPLTLS